MPGFGTPISTTAIPFSRASRTIARTLAAASLSGSFRRKSLPP
jgi:hypothetical protein